MQNQKQSIGFDGAGRLSTLARPKAAPIHPSTETNPCSALAKSCPTFKVIGVKPGFNSHEENGVSAFETVTNESLPGQVEGHLLLPEGLHLRLPDRDRRVRPPEQASSPTATPSSWAARPTTSTPSSAGAATHPDLDKLPIWYVRRQQRQVRPRASACSTRKRASPCAPPSWSTRTTSCSTSTSPT